MTNLFSKMFYLFNLSQFRKADLYLSYVLSKFNYFKVRLKTSYLEYFVQIFILREKNTTIGGGYGPRGPGGMAPKRGFENFRGAPNKRARGGYGFR